MPARRPARSVSIPASRMADVAQAAGVSMVTVSRAINSPDKVAAATLSAVRQAIERLRYLPNLTAGSLASNRTRIVGAIVPTIANSIFSETIDGLGAALAEHRYELLLGQTRYREDEEFKLVETFLGRRIDGLMLAGVKHARGVRARLQRAGIPVVETWDLTSRPIDMVVGFSNFEAGRAVARYLCGKGHRALAFIGGRDDRSAARLAGFRAGARDCGAGDITTAWVPSPSSVLDGGRALAELLRNVAPPGAVFCTNDMLAAGALFECRRRGIAIPAGIAVVGFADLPIAEGIEPTLTSVQVHSNEMGQRAGQLLLRRLAGDPQPGRIIDLGFSVVERASG